MEIIIEDIVLEAPKPEDADIAARLMYDADQHLIDYIFKGDQEIMQKCYEEMWKRKDGMCSHSLSTVARYKGALLGIEISYPAGTEEEHFHIGIQHAAEILSPEAYDHFEAAMGYLPYLLPFTPEDAYYVLFLSVIPEARGRGIGEKLLDNVFERAKAQGYRSCHLDVASDYPAVRFYKRVGMEVLSESRVPYLDEQYNIPMHYRMVKDLV